MLHEMAHVFLDRLKKLATSGLLKGDRNRARLDWGVILREYGLQNIDFNKALDDKGKALWKNANEQFASGFERYFMKGKSPTSRLRGVFEAFKGWLKGIYSSLSDIKYTDANGVQRKFNLSRDIEGVFKDMLGGMGELPGAKNRQTASATPNLNSNQQNNVKQETQAAQANSETPNQSRGTRQSLAQRILKAAKNGWDKIFSVAHVPQKTSRQNTAGFEFSNPETARRFREAENQSIHKGVIGRIRDHARDVIRSISGGDYAELTQAPDAKVRGLLNAADSFRRLERAKRKAISDTLASMMRNNRTLNKEQRHTFNAYMTLADLNWWIGKNPDGDLPFGLTPDDVRREFQRVHAIAHNDKAIRNAIQQEEAARKKLTDEYVRHAALLGIDMSKAIRNPHYFRHRVIEFVDTASRGKRDLGAVGNVDLEGFGAELPARSWLKRRKGYAGDIIADYWH